MGQPTHFLPGRRYGMFVFTMPKEFGKQQKISWVLTANGVTTSVPFYMSPDYNITPSKSSEESPGGGYNLPPVLRFSEAGTTLLRSGRQPREGYRPHGHGRRADARSTSGPTTTRSTAAAATPRCGKPRSPVQLTVAKYRGPGRRDVRPDARRSSRRCKGGKPDEPFSGKASTTVDVQRAGRLHAARDGERLLGQWRRRVGLLLDDSHRQGVGQRHGDP